MSARGLMGRWSAQDIRRVARIAWPTILENIMVIMVSFVDTAMVGQLGEDATAAVAVNASPSWKALWKNWITVCLPSRKPSSC